LVQRLLLGIGIALSVAWIVVSLYYPFGWDHGILSLVGDTVLRGGMPYRDAFDLKGPLAYLLFSLAELLFGRHQFGIRILEALALAGVAAALIRGSRHVAAADLRPWVAITLICWWSSLTFFHTAQPDSFCALGLALAFVPLLGGSTTRSVTTAGFVAGLVTAVKPVFGLFVFVPVLAVLLDNPARKDVARKVTLIALASLVPVMAVTVWFVARGALSDMYEILIHYNAVEYSGVTDPISRDRALGVGRFLMWFIKGPMIGGLPLVAVAMLSGWRERNRALTLASFWFLTGAAVILIQGRYFVYHWTVVMPPLTLLISAGATRVRAMGRSGLAAAACLIVIGTASIEPAVEDWRWARYEIGADTETQYYTRFRQGNYDAADETAAAEFLRTDARSGERIALFGYDGTAIYLSGLPNATRFTFPLPLLGLRSSPATRKHYQGEFLAGLDTRPAYVLVGLLYPSRAEAFKLFPELADVLKERYVLIRTFRNIQVYRLIGR